MKAVPVQLALFESEPAEFIIFLNPYSERRDGTETVDDYLNARRLFLPMMREGAPKIVNRDQIVWLSIRDYIDLAEVFENTAEQKLTILELVDGSRLEGMLDVDRPTDRSRISDVLNDPHEAFVRLNEERTTYFVNKQYIRIAIPR